MMKVEVDNCVTINVKVSVLCEAAAFCLGGSFAKEWQLKQVWPCPYRELHKVHALQRVCRSILHLAKHRPIDRVEIPVSIWNEIMFGKAQCLTAEC